MGCASAGEKALETYIESERDGCHDACGIHSKIRMLKQCGKARALNCARNSTLAVPRRNSNACWYWAGAKFLGRKGDSEDWEQLRRREERKIMVSRRQNGSDT